MFAHLHVHSQYSFLDGVSSPQEYAEKMQELNHTHIAATEHGRMTSHFEWHQTAQKYNITPVYGNEMYVNDNLVTHNEKKKRMRTSDAHITILAKNKIGYQNLLKLNYISNADDIHFYYSPRVTTHELLQHSNGLIFLSGCLKSKLSQLLFQKQLQEAEEYVKQFFDTEFYFEVQLNALKEQHVYNQFIIYLAKKYNKKIVLTNDVHYVQKDGYIIQDYAIAVRNKKTLQENDVHMSVQTAYYATEDDIHTFNTQFKYNYDGADINEWMNNAYEIATSTDVTIDTGNYFRFPHVTKNDEVALIERAKDGLMQIFHVSSFDDIPIQYKKRLYKELEILIRKGVASYLLILSDMMKYADDNKVMRGPGRGSAAGSLVVYALRITTVDPLQYNLLFERFLSDSRIPDMIVDYTR